MLKRASWDEASGLSNFTYGSENTYIAGMWQNHYAVIKDCNSVIDNVTTNKEKINNWERYVGQAHGIRAFLYFDLVRWFGDVPLVLTDTKSLDGLEVTRTPQKEVFRQIIEDFEYCISHTMDKGDTSKGYQMCIRDRSKVGRIEEQNRPFTFQFIVGYSLESSVLKSLNTEFRKLRI